MRIAHRTEQGIARSTRGKDGWSTTQLSTSRAAPRLVTDGTGTAFVFYLADADGELRVIHRGSCP